MARDDVKSQSRMAAFTKTRATTRRRTDGPVGS
jgi:hypothetical protein